MNGSSAGSTLQTCSAHMLPPKRLDEMESQLWDQLYLSFCVRGGGEVVVLGRERQQPRLRARGCVIFREGLSSVSATPTRRSACVGPGTCRLGSAPADLGTKSQRL